MIQPFASKQIKRFILFYVAIILFVVIFYLANTIFNPLVTYETKEFNTTAPQTAPHSLETPPQPPSPSPFKLMPRQ